MVYAVFALSSILSQELSTVFVDKIMLRNFMGNLL